jgi:glycosyltransferase involved in cell wall biosynthesis
VVRKIIPLKYGLIFVFKNGIKIIFKLMNKKLIRITTVPMSLKSLLKGQMSFMIKNGFDVIMISSDGKGLKDVIENEKCSHFIIPLTRKITPFKDLIATFSLYRLLIKEKPDIVHTHTPKAGIVGMLASFLARVPIRLHTVAGLPLMEATGFKRVILNFVEKLTYKLSTKVYPNSFELKNIILKNRFTTQEKLRVIGKGSSNGIDTSYFDPELFSLEKKNSLKSKLGIERNDFVFIFVGRLVADKGINELVEAFNELCLDLKGIKLLLVGPFEDDLDPLSEKTKLLISNHDKIISVGYQNDVRPFFAISNSLVFPSYREGFPNVVMQSGAMGLPSIVTDINGCNEIIQTDNNGIFVPTKDMKSLKRAMLRIFQDKELFLKCSANSRLAIVNNYEQK